MTKIIYCVYSVIMEKQDRIEISDLIKIKPDNVPIYVSGLNAELQTVELKHDDKASQLIFSKQINKISIFTKKLIHETRVCCDLQFELKLTGLKMTYLTDFNEPDIYQCHMETTDYGGSHFNIYSSRLFLRTIVFEDKLWEFGLSDGWLTGRESQVRNKFSEHEKDQGLFDKAVVDHQRLGEFMENILNMALKE